VGIGYYGPADNPHLIPDQGTRFAGQNAIDSIVGVKIYNQSYLVFADFDSPDTTRPECNRIGSRDPLPLEYVPTGGDSSGLYRDKNGKCEFIGIGPGGGIDADIFQKQDYNGQTIERRRVLVFYDWIISKIKKKMEKAEDGSGKI